eukprot:s38_g7.t3
MPSYALDYSKWKHIAEREALEEEDEIQRYEGELAREPVVTMDALYARESGHLPGAGSDRLHELKIKMAVETYESDDLSAPTLGWQAYTAPEPVPVIRYYTQEYSEAYALLYSNRSEVRMKLQDFRGAADDGDEALKYLKSLAALSGLNEETQALRRTACVAETQGVAKWKTVLRLARALQAMQRMSEAMRLLHHERRNFPECSEMQRLHEATRLALRSLGRGTPSQSRSGEDLGMDSQHGRKLMEYIAFISESLQHEIGTMKGRHGTGLGSPKLSSGFMAQLSKLEYILLKAQEVEEDVLESLQALLQTNGILRSLLNILEAQWKMNMEGKFVDLYKLPGALEVVNVTALICQGNEANLRFVSSEALSLWAALGGCNCKVRGAVCERLVALIFGLWNHCRHQTLELVQSNSAMVERAAFYLSQAVQSSPEDDAVFGPDSPAVSLACKEQAALLLLDLLAQGAEQGGRIKRRALRGIISQLAGRNGGGGFFQSSQAAVRTLGELVAKNAVDDPQLVDDPQDGDGLDGLGFVQLALLGRQHWEVTHMVLAIQQMMKEANGGKDGPLLDLADWKTGRYCVILLELVSITLEQKLLKDRELQRGGYAAAFGAEGLEMARRLLEAPPELAEKALRCLAAMAQTYVENVEQLISLGVVQALLGPGEGSHLAETLELPLARRYAARVLMQCTAAKEFTKAIEQQPERCVQQLVKWDDGVKSAEAFQEPDIMHVFHFLVTSDHPELLGRHLRAPEMLQLLLRLETSPTAPAAPLAREILTTLGKEMARRGTDRNFKRVLAPVKRLYDEGYDPDLELKLRQQISGDGREKSKDAASASPEQGRRLSGTKEEPKEAETKVASKTKAKMTRAGSQAQKSEPEQQKSDPFADLKTAFEPVKEKATTFNLKQIVTRTGTVLMNMLERLLETTHIDAVDVESDMTLLEFACTSGNLGLAKLCYRRGAKMMAISKRGETAFNIVTRNRRYDIMEFLHIYGVKINSADANGKTALHVAAENNDVDGICRLLEWGADVNIADQRKRTPIHLAAAGGHMQATMLLLEVGADMNAKDVKEYTAMAHAEANNHFNLMDRLVQLGAKGHGLHHHSGLAASKSKSTTSLHGGTALAVPAGMLKSTSLGRIGKVVVHGMPGPIVPQLLKG